MDFYGQLMSLEPSFPSCTWKTWATKCSKSKQQLRKNKIMTPYSHGGIIVRKKNTPTTSLRCAERPLKGSSGWPIATGWAENSNGKKKRELKKWISSGSRPTQWHWSFNIFNTTARHSNNLCRSLRTVNPTAIFQMLTPLTCANKCCRLG